MKSVFLALFVVLFVSCSTDDGVSYNDYSIENEQEISAYVASNQLDAFRTSSGLYVVVEDEGEGNTISTNSDVTVRYKATYTDGVVIDENLDEAVSFNLQYVIPGWIEGLQYFNEGGSGKLIVPAHLAYGSNDYNGVPGGSVIVFDIEVVDYNAENKQDILEYIEANNLNAEATASGLYYVIEEAGSGVAPTAYDNVTVTYKGYFTDETVFDESNDSGVTFNLDTVIEGWKEGLQYFNEGGSGKLLIPSSLAYGRYGNSAIPGGAVLIFDVQLLKVN